MRNTVLIFFSIGLILGLGLYHLFLVPEVKTKVVITERIVTDTTYSRWREMAILSNQVDSLQNELQKKPKIIHRVLRDTIIEPFAPKISLFSADFTLLHGNARLTGEVLGEVLKTKLETDFKIPVVTNTIEREKVTTNTIIQKGIFGGGGMNNQGDPVIGAAYLGNGFLINADYSFVRKEGNYPSVVTATAKINLFQKK